MNTFLNEVAKYINSKYSSNFHQALILMPNRRSCLFLEKEFTEHLNGQTTWLPKIVSLKDWISQHSVLSTADELVLIFYLYPLFQKHVDSNITFDDFYYLGKILLNDFNEIDNELINENIIFSNIYEYEELKKKFSIEDELSKIFEKYSSIFKTPKLDFYNKVWAAIGKIYNDFRTQLLEKRIAYDGFLNRYFYEQEINNINLPTNVFFVGLNALSKSEQFIVERIHERTNVAFLWEYDDWYINNELNNAGKFLRKWINKHPNPDDFKVNTNNISNKSVNVYEFDNEVAQVKYLPEILKKVCISESSPKNHVAIVLANEKLLQNVLNALPNNLKQVNITMGYPVSYTWIYCYIELLFNLNQSLKNGIIKTNSLLNFLYHPLIVNKEWSAELINEIKKSSQFTYKSENLQSSNMPDFIKKFLFQCQDIEEKIKTLCDILINVENELLANYNEHGYVLIEIQSIRKLYQAIDKFIELVRKFKISFTLDKTWHNLILQILNSQKIDLFGEPLTGLQIMGIFETRLLDFENIIFLSLNEDYIPAKQQSQTFIAHSFRKYFDLTTADKREAISAFHFYRLLQRSSNIHLAYSTLVDDKPTGPSTYIRQIDFDSSFKIKRYNPILKFDILEKANAIELSKTELEQEWKLYLSELNNKGIYRNSISDYIICPLRFCFRNVLKLKSNDFFIEPNENKEIGILFHDAVKEIFTNFKGKNVTTDDLEKLIDEISDKIITPQNINEAVKHLQISQFIKKFIEYEITQNVRKYPLRVIFLEDTISAKLTFGNNNIELNGKADLILQDDTAVYIIDFKTSGSKYVSKINEIGELFQQDNKYSYAFQLFFYGYIFNKKLTQNQLPVYLENIFLKQLNSEKNSIIKLNDNYLNVKDFHNEFESLLIQLFEEMLNEQIPFKQTEEIKNCEYCDFNVICKKN